MTIGTNRFNDYGLLARLVGMAMLLSPVIAQAGLADSRTLRQRVETGEDVNVIVTYRRADQLLAAWRTADLDSTSVKGAVSGLQRTVLGWLPQGGYRNPVRFKYLPQLALTVNREGLKALVKNGDLVEVQENAPRFPNVEDSVPHIFKDRAISPWTGQGVAVAVLDSGVDSGHPFFGGRVVSEACYSGSLVHPAVSSFCPGGASSATGSGSGAPCPSGLAGCDHGTHVAGIVAGDGAAWGGVAQQAGLIAIQVFSRVDGIQYCYPSSSCIAGFVSDIILGLERVYDLRGQFEIAAANLSLGGSTGYTGACDSDPEKPAIDLLRSAGIATVVASGNKGFDERISSPACISSAVAVGATEHTSDVRAWFSNSSPMLDLYAPGEGIVSSVPGGGFAAKSGTSMAAPHVAGAWAVVRQKAPDATVDEIEAAFKGAGPWITVAGVARRRIDVDAALAAFLDPAGNDGVIIPMLDILLF